MFCSQCGAQVSDGAAFCSNCGARLAPQPAQAPQQPATATPEPAPAPQPVQAPQQPACRQVPDYGQQAGCSQRESPYAYGQQAAYQQAAPQPTCPPAQPKPSFKMPKLSELFVGYNKAGVQYAESVGLQMKWYKALTVALLYLAAAANLSSAVQFLSGGVYGGSASYIYNMHPALHALDIIYGLLCIALALAILYIRMRLAQFAGDGPSLYLTLILVNAGTGAVYSLLSSIIVGSSGFATVGSSLAVSVAMYLLNRTYFGKRQYLFTM